VGDQGEPILPMVSRKASLTRVDPLYSKIMEYFRWTCTWQGCWMPAICIHHEPPKSVADEMCYAFPACLDHHEEAHTNRTEAESKFMRGAEEVLDFYNEGGTKVLPWTKFVLRGNP